MKAHQPKSVYTSAPREIGLLDASGQWKEKLTPWLEEWHIDYPVWSFRTVFKFLSYLDRGLSETETQRFLLVNPEEPIIRNKATIYSIISEHVVGKASSVILLNNGPNELPGIMGIADELGHEMMNGDEEKLRVFLKGEKKESF